MESNENCPPISYFNLNLSTKDSGFNLLSNSNNTVNEMLRTTIEIPFTQLSSLKKEYLLDLLRFITTNCHMILENEKLVNSTFSIFKIIKNINDNGYNIIQNENANNKIFEDNVLDKKKEDFNKNTINENKEIKHNFKPPILCSIHDLQFSSLEDYIYHCWSHNTFLCEECGKNFLNFIEFKNHLNVMKNENININSGKENLINNIKNENKIKCTECNLLFNNIESMTMHYYDCHEKIKIQKKEEELKIKEEIEKQEKLKQAEIDKQGRNRKIKKIRRG